MPSRLKLRLLIVITIISLLTSCNYRASGKLPLDIDPSIYASLEGRDSSQIGNLRVAHVSDIHHFAPALYNSEDPAFVNFTGNNEGRTVLYTGALLEGLKIDLLAEKVNILLISGDLSILGARETHEDVARILSGIEQTGVRVFVTPGNHDVNNPDAVRITSDGAEPVPWTTPEEFQEIYANYGYEEGIMVHDESLSYMAYLDNSMALLSLDSAYYQNNAFLDHAASPGVVVFSLYPWVDEALAQAKTDGRRVIAMTHHNFLRHYETDRDLSNFMINDEGQMLNKLAAAGVELAFSGHIHKSDIKTEMVGGKAFTSIATTALPLYPHSYRVLGIAEDQVGITTRLLSLPYDEDTNREILEYNRNIGMNRTFYGRENRYTDDYSRRDAEAIAWFFHIANLYSQQGLEAYLPEEILDSRATRLVGDEEGGMLGFMKSLPLDTEPDDWDTSLPLSDINHTTAQR